MGKTIDPVSMLAQHSAEASDQLIEQLADSSYGFQLSWKISTEGLVDEICNRFAPDYDLDYQIAGSRLTVTRFGNSQRTLEVQLDDQDHPLLLQQIMHLIDHRALKFKAFASGDDLDYLLIPATMLLSMKKANPFLFEDLFDES